MLEDTTVASGLNEGVEGGYHGSFEDGAPEGWYEPAERELRLSKPFAWG
jgi:hypothetical protein